MKLKLKLKLFLLFMLVVSFAVAQNPPTAAPTTPIALPSAAGVKSLNEVQRQAVIIAYQRGLLAQINLSQAQTQLNEAAAAFDATQATIAKEIGMPAETKFNVNLQSGQVTPISSTTTPATPAAPTAPTTTKKQDAPPAQTPKVETKPKGKKP